MDNINIWEYVVEFCCSRAFVISASLFFGWLLLFRILRLVKNTTVLVFTAAFGLISPFKLRKILFNSISLIFMVGGTASASAAKAQLSGGVGKLEAIVGGGCALALWGLVMTVFNNASALKEVAKKEVPANEPKKV